MMSHVGGASERNSRGLVPTTLSPLASQKAAPLHMGRVRVMMSSAALHDTADVLPYFKPCAGVIQCS